MNQIKFITFAILISFFICGCLNQKLSVDNAWARPGIKGDTSAVYLVIDNPLEQTDILYSAETVIAEYAEIHLSKFDDAGMMTMEHQDSVQIESRTRILFQPGGLHIMLTNLHKDLNLEDTFSLTLNFEKAGSFEIEAVVREP